MGLEEQSAIPVESTSNNFTVEKPHLRSRILHLLDRADAEPDSKKRFAFLERARDLARPLRKQDGQIDWPAICCAALTFAILLAAAIHVWPKAYVYQAPDYSVRILDRVNAHTFVMQWVYRGVPRVPVTEHFKGYDPQFEPGMTLIWFAYDDHGSYISVAPEDRGYVIMRGPDHLPVLAKNCHPDFVNDRVVCNGKPQFD